MTAKASTKGTPERGAAKDAKAAPAKARSAPAPVAAKAKPIAAERKTAPAPAKPAAKAAAPVKASEKASAAKTPSAKTAAAKAPTPKAAPAQPPARAQAQATKSTPDTKAETLPKAPAASREAPSPAPRPQPVATRAEEEPEATPVLAEVAAGSAPARPATARPSVAEPAAPAPSEAAPIQAPMRPAPPPKPLGNAGKDFKAGDHVVYPTHGVGQVQGIEEIPVAGLTLKVIVITFEENRMTLKVPMAKAASSGLRKLASDKVMGEAMDTLRGRARIKRTMWSRRAQEYEQKINSGDPIAIAEVVRDLHRNAGQPDQSFSERQIYELALDRLAAEVGALDRTDKATATQKLLDHLKTVEKEK
ncbi:CarD family transcriptional regulator [Muricoccus radiodurans]|uniref:CarD family transcriptional regulator n=1 Tax=Muricoccus radiodurans TaxID=2231721 RepID=UPI003CEE2C51